MDTPPVAVSSHIAIFSLLLLTSSYAIANSNTTYESLIQCLLQDHPSNSTTTSFNILYKPDTTSYTTLYQSSIQNLRVINPHTPKPFLIVAPTLESQVQTSVVCAREHGVELRVRSGGHDYEGLSYVSHDGRPFVIVDLNNLRSIAINRTDGTAWVQAGATLGEVYYTIGENNQTTGFPAGLCPTVGVGGHLTGGGLGTMMRKYGLAADNILDAHLVTSKGELLDLESMGEDLFWAIRGGGGGNYGIILSYKIKLVQVPPKVTVFTKTMAFSQGAAELVNKWQHIAYKLHEDLFIRLILQALNQQGKNKTINIFFNSMFLGTKQDLLPLMEESFPELGLEDADCTEMSWVESTLYFGGYSSNVGQVSMLLNRTAMQNNVSFKAKSDFLREPISEKGWEGIWRWFREGDEQPIMIIDPLGGKMAEISESETPFPYRNGSLYNIQYYMNWKGEGSKVAKKHEQWMRRFYRSMAPYVSKHPRAAYVNYRDLDLGRNGKGKVSYSKAKVWGVKYFKDNFKRLAQVKSMVDPINFFRNEQSIPTLNSYSKVVL